MTNDWSGETEEKEFYPDELVTLPVGIKKDGQIYKEVVVEEMCGIDDHNIAKKARGDNGAIATSLVLCRCIQEVPGLLSRKKNPDKMFDRALARAMCSSDRDYVLSRIYMMGGRNDAIMAGKCSRCGLIWEEDIKLSNLPVKMWGENDPWEFSFTLDRGFRILENGQPIYHKDCIMRFPTGKDAEQLGNIKDPATALDSLIACCIIKAGEISSVDTNMAKSLSSNDRQIISASAQYSLPGMQQWMDIYCSCGKEVELTLDLASFLDDRRKRMKK